MTGPSPGDGSGPVTDEEEVLRVEYDRSSVVPTAAIVEAVSTATGRESTALPPLYEAVDTDALNAFLDTDGRQATDGPRTVSFEYAGSGVTVSADGTVAVDPEGPL